MTASNWSSTFSNPNVDVEGTPTTENNSYVYASSKNTSNTQTSSSWSAFNQRSSAGASSASTMSSEANTQPAASTPFNYVLTNKASAINSITNIFNASPEDDVGTVSGDDLNSLLDGYTNPLLVGENVSWRCKLFSISSADFVEYQSSKDVTEYTQYILAETGVTSHYAIDEVVINTLPSGTEFTKNGTMTKIMVKLSETGSLKLFDDLQLAVQALGYGYNFSELPLFVEMAFVGYNSNTHQPYTLPETRLWACSIANSTCKVVNGGSQTVYEMSLLRHIGSFVNNTKDNSGSVAGQNIEFTAPATFGEAIKELEKQCNKALAAIYPNWPKKFANKVTPTSYITFSVDSELADAKILTDKQQDPASDNNNKTPTSKKFSFNAGATYSNMINDILSSVQHPEDRKDVTKCVFADVHIENRYLGFDDDHNSSAYAIILHIIKVAKFDNQGIEDYRDSNTVTDLMEKLKEGHKKNSNLRIKRYDYLWSGLNTEILNFDFNFNGAAAVSITRNIIGQYDSHNRKGVKRSQYVPVDPISDGREARAYGATTPQPKSKLTADVSDSLVTQRLSLNETAPTEGESLQDTIMSFLNPTAKKTKVYTFDDLDLAYDAGMPLSPRFISKNTKDITSGTDDSNSHKAEIVKRMIRSNYYNSSTLLRISLDVVGDPHWLGPSDKNIDLVVNKVTNKFSNASQNIDGNTSIQTNYDIECIKNESCFVLNLYPAKYYNQETGIASQDPDSVLAQCLYRVISITSTFNSSGFKQTLQASGILKSLNQ